MASAPCLIRSDLKSNSETTAMAMQPQISAAFLADLDTVCPKADDSKFPFTFLKDLEGGSTNMLFINVIESNFCNK